MRLSKVLNTLVLIVLHCSSCTYMTEITQRRLEEIETVIYEYPDSALNTLRDTDPETIRNRRTRARLHLLHSIALDKNGIDITNDSIIRPALKFYSARKASQQQFQTYYYTARIFENREDYSLAMEYLVRAEKSIKEVDDNEIIALLYSTKGRIYNRMLEYDQAALNFGVAASHYKSSGNQNKYISNRLRAADCLVMSGHLDNARKTITEIGDNLNELGQNNLNKYYLLLLRIMEYQESEQVGHILNEYLKVIQDPWIIDWLYVARIYINDGNADKGIEALELHRTYKGANASYHYWLGHAYEAKSMFQESIIEFRKYDRLSGALGKSILAADTKFVEEREMHRQMHEKDKERRRILYLMLAVILLALAFASAAILAGVKQLKIRKLERDNLARQIDELILEREELAILENNNRKGRKIIAERLRIIDQFVISDAFNDSLFEKKATETLKRIICDREEFVRQNRMIFNQSAPKFMEFLTDRGLTDTEIDHCCLYAIGMNGKMVMTFTNAKRHYHIGSDVRKKLGLGSHDTNISIYIRQLYDKFEEDGH